MNNIRFQILAVLVLALFASHANAQFVVKRLNCADAVIPVAGFPQFPYHLNSAAGAKDITIQVVRDGCRPRFNEGQFDLVVRTAGGSIVAGPGMIRDTKYPSSATETIAASNHAFVRFRSFTSGRISGTFDYAYTID